MSDFFQHRAVPSISSNATADPEPTAADRIVEAARVGMEMVRMAAWTREHDTDTVISDHLDRLREVVERELRGAGVTHQQEPFRHDR